MKNDFDIMYKSLLTMLERSDIPERYYTPLEPSNINAIKILAKTYKERSLHGGLQYTAYFENGYGIDIVKHNGSYGHEDDQWEIAVMKDGECYYGTPITDDVIGYLTSAEVMNYVMKVEALDPA